jgi:hypothetical protein
MEAFERSGIVNLQEYWLTKLAEECDEVGQRVMKALQFSLDEVQPGQTDTNRQRIEAELRDLLSVAALLIRKGILTSALYPSEDQIQTKAAKIEKFMEISFERGALEELEL